MKRQDELIHSILDGEIPLSESSKLKGIDAEKLSVYREKLSLLEELEEKAPDDFVDRVMVRLPDSPNRGWFNWARSLWPRRGLWAAPAFAGALSVVLVLFGIRLFYNLAEETLVPVHFEVYAPSAKTVELVGTFSGWLPGRIRFKGPDAVGYWGSFVKLRPGRYEYLFLIDGTTLVSDGDALASCPDGFGSENSVLLVGEKGAFRGGPFPWASTGDIYASWDCREEVAFPLPEKQRAGWESILNQGVSAGLQRTRLERTLARLARKNISPEKVETIFSPLFNDMEAGEHAKDVFLEIEEGILKGASFQALVASVFKKNDLFLKTRKDFLKTGPADRLDLPSGLQASVVAALERGLSERLVRETVEQGKRFHSDEIKHLMDAMQLLHYAGLKEAELKKVVHNCFEKDLESEEINSIVRRIMEQIREGIDGKTICQGLQA